MLPLVAPGGYHRDSADTCRTEVQWYADQGVDMLLLLVQGGPMQHDDICDSLRRFGAEVMPKFA